MSRCHINVAVVETSDVIFEGLSVLLQKAGAHYFIYRALDAEELAELCEKEGMHVLIVNPITMLNKTQGMQRIRKAHPEVYWVALQSTLVDNDLLGRFDAAISINDSPERIVASIQRGYEHCDCTRPQQESLSDRELDVLSLLVRGLSNRDIAENLNISVHTVISHRKNISDKTGIKSLPGLTVYAITRKLLSIEQH